MKNAQYPGKERDDPGLLDVSTAAGCFAFIRRLAGGGLSIIYPDFLQLLHNP